MGKQGVRAEGIDNVRLRGSPFQTQEQCELEREMALTSWGLEEFDVILWEVGNHWSFGIPGTV